MKLITCCALLFATLITSPATAQDVVRGLKTVLIKEVDSHITRRYPSVLVPRDISVLSFELSGKLKAIDLHVGQRVKAGDVLASLDETVSNRELQRATAAVEQAKAEADHAADNLSKQESRLERGVATRDAVDTARTQAATSSAKLDQA